MPTQTQSQIGANLPHPKYSTARDGQWERGVDIY